MAFKTLSEVLKNVRSKYPGFSRRMQEAEAVSRWSKAVGESISRHTRARCVRQGVLWVEVDHPIWKTELHYRKPQILSVLNEQSEGRDNRVVIKDLFFVDQRR